ncbi:MAG: hypothetical protein DMG96_32970 [Acidobacteria bacterium]|nr:MAG: hypothetical protein DMG96_32970 [Acidobacteriota bacterium]
MYRKKTAGLLAGWLFGFVLSLQAQLHPKLIVVVVVDQMRADYLDRFASYEHGGLHFLATQGANFLNANFEHLPTETCPGHAVLLSGRNPVHTGIVANDWYDRDTGKMMYCVEDANSVVIGDSGAAVSPRNFLGENFSDWLQTSYPGARVFSISLKDRAAILLGGHHPQSVLWFSHETGRFITSRYYADRLPGWVEEFNSKRVPDSYASKEWTPVMGDSSPAYHTREVAGRFPHVMPSKAGRELYDRVYGSPFGDEVLGAFAESAATANQLGENPRDAPDLLAIGFSSNDAVGHAYGPDGPEMADEQIRLDRTLGHLVESLSARLGKENVLWVLSADHGAEPTPEAELELDHNRSARRIPFSDALNSMEKQLSAIFRITGDVHWFAGQADSMLYFDRAELARHGISLAAASRALVTQVHDVPGVAGFYDTSRLASVPGWIGTFLRNSASTTRSGDVYYLTKEWTLFSSKSTGTSHGDPWPYDTHVPLVIAGWRIQPQRIKRNVQIADLAPTLASLIGVHSPRLEVVDGRSRKDWLKLRAHTDLKQP